MLFARVKSALSGALAYEQTPCADDRSGSPQIDYQTAVRELDHLPGRQVRYRKS
jgi:hypothetical protein